MNGIKGYISIREASYRWGVSPPHWNWKHPQKGSECDDLR